MHGKPKKHATSRIDDDLAEPNPPTNKHPWRTKPKRRRAIRFCQTCGIDLEFPGRFCDSCDPENQ